MDTFPLHVQFDYVSLGFRFYSECGHMLQGSHMHHMYMSSLYVQTAYVSLGLLLFSQGSHMQHMDTFPFIYSLGFLW